MLIKKWLVMTMDDANIILAMQEAVRKSIAEAANAEIEKQKHRFECEMGNVKSELIGKLVNNIQIAAKHQMPDGNYVIQIVLKGGQK